MNSRESAMDNFFKTNLWANVKASGSDWIKAGYATGSAQSRIVHVKKDEKKDTEHLEEATNY